jgi:protocatechuate 3,4-dioxygenase alpha subunit
MALIPTGEMTLGPFFPREFGKGNADLIASNRISTQEDILIEGRVTQVDGRALDNVIVELWQASPQGRYDDPAFFGWGRAATDASGVYRFRTVMPGAVPGRARHVNLIILYSGLMRHLQTTLFFSDEPDPVLDAVPSSRRSLLVAKKSGNTYSFDIRLRGEGETPFFDD